MNPGLDIAARIARGEAHAREIAEATLARIRDADRQYNCFTALIAERALAEADAIDRRRARGEPLGPLAGVPYAVKNLFDVAGIVTLAGSKINADNAPAARDAFAIQRLHTAGAVLVGALNMEEYAYGFTTENFHYGPTRNSHDTTRIADDPVCVQRASEPVSGFLSDGIKDVRVALAGGAHYENHLTG
jgi:1-carboxybiuret hydrolase